MEYSRNTIENFDHMSYSLSSHDPLYYEPPLRVLTTVLLLVSKNYRPHWGGPQFISTLRLDRDPHPKPNIRIMLEQLGPHPRSTRKDLGFGPWGLRVCVEGLSLYNPGDVLEAPLPNVEGLLHGSALESKYAGMFVEIIYVRVQWAAFTD